VLYCFSDRLVEEALDGFREGCESSRRVTPSLSSLVICRLLKAKLLIMAIFILPLWSELSPVKKISHNYYKNQNVVHENFKHY
jgi:hypothetical protein